MPSVNEKHKDRLFKFIFGNPEKREWTLDLYNAVNGSNYTNAEDIEFNTIDDVIYMGMKNDVSFIVEFVMNLWEHQSSLNPNLPVRFLLYASKLYEKHTMSGKFSRFSRKLQRLPKPKCVCFYNGTEKQPEEVILKLSDAFDGHDGDIELVVRMLNVNYGHNMELMKGCKVLEEYSYFIEGIRENQKAMDIESAIDSTLEGMPDDFTIRKFLLMNRAEVKGMFLTEYDEEKELANLRQEERKEGIKIGREEGHSAEKERTANAMLKRNYPLEAIIDITQLTENTILTLAENLGIICKM